MKKKLIIIRVDGNFKIGFGHFERQYRLALYFLKKNYKVIFVSNNLYSNQAKKLNKKKIRLINTPNIPGSNGDLKFLKKIIIKNSANFLILDSYKITSGFQKKMLSKNYKLIVYDDYSNLSNYYCDFLINQNIYANKKLYFKKINNSILLLGAKFFSIEKKIYTKKYEKNSKNILICLGGSINSTLINKILNFISSQNIENIKFFIIGKINKMKLPIKIREKVLIKDYTDNIHKIASLCNFAITGGGNLALEMSILKKKLLLFQINNTQKQNIEFFRKKRLAIIGGTKDKLNKKNIEKFLKNNFKQRKLNVNGDGHKIIFNVLEKR